MALSGRRPTLHDFDGHALDQAAVAATLPTSWKDAVAAYVTWRTAAVKSPLMDLKATTEFVAKDIAYQCAALVEIQKRLGSDVKKKPTIKIVEPDKRQRLQNEIDLASLLTPQDWQKLYGPVIDSIRQEAETEILQQKNIRANQALGAEANELLKFLQRTEQVGLRALAQLERQKRGLDPRGPRDSAVRLVM